MSDRLICLVWKSLPRCGAMLNVLQAIADESNEQGNCYISISKVAVPFSPVSI